MKKERKLESNIWKFYLYKIFFGIFFSVPIIVLFWQKNGLSLTEVMILQSIYSLLVVFLEVPTGYFADVFGRKKSLVYGGALYALAVASYGISSSFSQFLIAEVIFAFALSLVSGSDSAFVYDTLKDLKKEKKYKKIWGNAYFYSLIAMAASNAIGGFIGKIDFRLTFYVTIPFLLMLIPISLSFKEPKRHKLIFKKGYILEIFKILKLTFTKNKKLKWLIIYSGIIFGFNQSVLWLYQPYFQLSGLDIIHFGFIFASFQIVAAISSKYAHKLEKMLGENFSLAMLVFLTGISFLLMGNFIYLFSFSFVFLQQFVRGFREIVISDYIHKLTDSSIRATVMSTHNLISRLFYAMIVPIIGLVADVYSLTQALTVLGVTTLVFGVTALVIFLKTRSVGVV